MYIYIINYIYIYIYTLSTYIIYMIYYIYIIDNIYNTYHIYYMVCDNRYKDVFYTITLKWMFYVSALLFRASPQNSPKGYVSNFTSLMFLPFWVTRLRKWLPKKIPVLRKSQQKLACWKSTLKTLTKVWNIQRLQWRHQ